MVLLFSILLIFSNLLYFLNTEEKENQKLKTFSGVIQYSSFMSNWFGSSISRIGDSRQIPTFLQSFVHLAKNLS